MIQVLTLICVLAATETPTKQVDVAVDERVELISIVFRMAGFGEYSQGQLTDYNQDVDRHFSPFKDHTLIQLAQKLRTEKGIGFDACMSYAVHLDALDSWPQSKVFASRPPYLEKRWSREEAELFFKELKDFAEVSDYRAFFASQKQRYRQAEARFKLLLPAAKLEWFDGFFGEQPSSSFKVFLGLLNGGANYATRRAVDPHKTEFFCILGAWLKDEQGAPLFDTTVLPTVVHEFSHSYVNHVTVAFHSQLKPGGQALFSRVKDQMERQAYSNWETMINESLVRASVVRYIANTQSEAKASEEIQEQIRSGFLWMAELSQLLKQFETSRKPGQGLKEFMPRVVTFFENYANNGGQHSPSK